MNANTKSEKQTEREAHLGRIRYFCKLSQTGHASRSVMLDLARAEARAFRNINRS